MENGSSKSESGYSGSEMNDDRLQFFATTASDRPKVKRGTPDRQYANDRRDPNSREAMYPLRIDQAHRSWMLEAIDVSEVWSQ